MDKYIELMKTRGVYLKPYTDGIETAFYAKDVFYVIDCLDYEKYIILGGDILIMNNDEVKYTYDNWFYNGDKSLTIDCIQKKSIEITKYYLEKYNLEENNLVVFVVITKNEYAKEYMSIS